MSNIREVSGQVKAILEKDVQSRNSDDRLYYLVCKERLEEDGFNFMDLSFAAAMLYRKQYGIPPYESVRRTRQKIQQAFPELRGNTEVEAMRMVKEEEYRAYARGVNA